MKTYKNYEELEKELLNDKEVQSYFGGLTPVYDTDGNEIENTYVINVKTKYGNEIRKVKVLQDDDE